MQPPSRRVRIAPSLLSANLARLAEEIRAVEEAGADWLHLDVMDGRFVPNLTFGVPILAAIKKITSLPLDVHLMIVEPERHIEAFAKAGADHLTVHPEASVHLERTLASIQSFGCKAGVALNPSTPLSSLDYIWHRLDLVLLMTVNPGFGGQTLISEVLPKITSVRQEAERRGKKVDICVDGGVNTATSGAVISAGADLLVAGNAIFSCPKDRYAEMIASLRSPSSNFGVS